MNNTTYFSNYYSQGKSLNSSKYICISMTYLMFSQITFLIRYLM